MRLLGGQCLSRSGRGVDAKTECQRRARLMGRVVFRSLQMLQIMAQPLSTGREKDDRRCNPGDVGRWPLDDGCLCCGSCWGYLGRAAKR